MTAAERAIRFAAWAVVSLALACGLTGRYLGESSTPGQYVTWLAAYALCAAAVLILIGKPRR